MDKRMVGALFLVCGALAMSNPVSAQNPCKEIGSDCRVMTPAEVQAFEQLVLAVKAALPVPDVTRYEPDGAIEASTMPFVADTNTPGAVPTCRAWPAGSFPESPQNTLLFGYVLKAKPAKAGGQQKDPLAAVQEMMAEFENRIQVAASLLPHPFLVGYENGKIVDVSDPDATNIEKSEEFLSWESNEGTDLHMIFGPRTAEEEDTLIREKPTQAFAPVRSIELGITGPKAEVAALKRKIDRKVFESFLGPVVK